MKAALVIITLLHQGYWYAEQEVTIDVQWADAVDTTPATWRWEMRYGRASLATGQIKLDGAGPARATLTAPKVRVRSKVQLKWWLIADEGDQVLDRGSATLHVFPPGRLETVGRLFENRSLIVCDSGKALSHALSQAEIDHEAVSDPSKLVGKRADVIVIGPGTLPKDAMHQLPVISHARAGATVLVFRHAERKAVLGWPIVERLADPPLHWRMVHPLLAGLSEADVASLLPGAGKIRSAVRLAADAPALPIGYLINESEDASAAVDALMFTARMGEGRVLVCQLDLADWADDPRARMLLANALSYSTSPMSELGPVGEAAVHGAKGGTDKRIHDQGPGTRKEPNDE